MGGTVASPGNPIAVRGAATAYGQDRERARAREAGHEGARSRGYGDDTCCHTAVGWLWSVVVIACVQREYKREGSREQPRVRAAM